MGVNKKSIVSEPVFCCVTEESGLNPDINVTCSVEYEYNTDGQGACAERSVLPVDELNKRFEESIKSDTDSVLMIAFARLTQENISYQQLQQKESAIAEILSQQLSDTWKDRYGVEICSIKVSNIKASAQDEVLLLGHARDYANAQDPANLAQQLMAAINVKTQDASVKPQDVSTKLQNVSENSQETKPQEVNSQNTLWMCSCGHVSTGKFCPECGSARPTDPKMGWKCAKCSTENKGKFCMECGSPFPA